jgi:UDP-N-acetylglucosamine acyltransferase
MASSNIHPTAIIAPDAKIAQSAVIGPYTVIGKKTTIGAGTRVGPHCVIENTVMGEKNEIIAAAFIGVKPQDLSYNGVESMVIMGNGNQVREGVTIHRATSLESPTTIGDNCLFMANAHVAHDCVLGSNIIMVNNAGIAGHVIIEDRALLSGMVAVHQFVRVGRLAMVAGLSGLPLDVPPFCRASGGRAKLVGLNTVGLRRSGFSRDIIAAVKAAYRQLFHSTKTLRESIEILRKNNPAPQVLEMIEFIENSKRGITAARRRKTDAAGVSDDE